MGDKVRVGIVGVSGYGGGELVSLLSRHPRAEIVYVTSHTYNGKPLYAALPGVDRRLNLVCEEFDPSLASKICDVIYLAGEAGLAMRSAPALLNAGRKVIDLSADFRLKDPNAYAQWYKAEHKAPELLPRAVYGLPELNEHAIRSADLIANPGCYPTGAALALAPLVARRLVDLKSVVVDSLSGVSGGGRSKVGDYHFADINESVKPYGVGGTHRHTPEIEQTLATAAGQPITLTFTPHLVPITRGILTTAYASFLDAAPDLHEIYRAFYREAPFVTVLAAGEYPATKNVYGTNNCHIGVAVDKRTNRAVVITAIDNLVKGMAGQAVQNMNLMFGLDQSTGLDLSAVWP